MREHLLLISRQIHWCTVRGLRGELGPERRLSAEELMLLNCGAVEDLWRRKWQPTPVFLPGESQGWGSLVGCRLWGCTESDTTEVT